MTATASCRRVAAVGVALVAAATVGAGCSSDADPSAVEIADPWVRPSAEVANEAEAYLDLTAETDDALVEVEVDSDLAAGASLVESAPTEAPDADGTVGRSPIDEVDLPAGETVALEPGGRHIVLVGLTEAVEAGDEIDLTLSFRGGATETVTAEVRDE